MFDLRSPGVTVSRSPSSTVSPASPSCSWRTCSSPTTRQIGELRRHRRGQQRLEGRDEHGGQRARTLAALPGRFLATTDRLVDLWRTGLRTPTDGLDRPGVVDAWIGARAYELSTYATVSRLAAGGQLGMESSINKVFWSRWGHRCPRDRPGTAGADAELADGWTDGYLFSLSGPIYAGTNEIQRNVIAERLGLPRGTADMEFLLDDEHVGLAEKTIRRPRQPTRRRRRQPGWADGDTAPGLKLWSSLAELGITGLLVDDEHGGAGPAPSR